MSIILDAPWSDPDCVFATEACLTGCGGICGDRVFHAPFPDWILKQFPAIHHLECPPRISSSFSCDSFVGLELGWFKCASLL